MGIEMNMCPVSRGARTARSEEYSKVVAGETRKAKHILDMDMSAYRQQATAFRWLGWQDWTGLLNSMHHFHVNTSLLWWTVYKQPFNIEQLLRL